MQLSGSVTDVQMYVKPAQIYRYYCVFNGTAGPTPQPNKVTKLCARAHTPLHGAQII